MTQTTEPEEPQDDNMHAAMERVVDALEPTIAARASDDETENASRQVLIRATEKDHERWKAAAAKEKISVSEFIRNCCNKAAGNILECQHPLHMRKVYPWSERCLACGKRLR